MLSYKDLLTEVKQRRIGERLALLEELAHSLREEYRLSPGSNISQVTTKPETNKTPEELGWPPGYFEQTYGSLRSVDIERPPQEDFQIREV